MSTELIKILIAAFILGSVLHALGAALWVQMVCGIGLGFFWIGPSNVSE